MQKTSNVANYKHVLNILLPTVPSGAHAVSKYTCSFSKTLKHIRVLYAQAVRN